MHCEITLTNYKKNGDEFFINILVSPVFDNEGTCTHFVAIERDITERRKTAQHIEQLNERFSLISKITHDALFEWNFEKKEIWWSESHFTMFGFNPSLPYPSREEWLLKLHPESQKLIENIVNDIAHNGLNNWQYEIYYYKPDRTTGVLLHRGFVMRNEQQQPVRMLGSYIDITQQKNEELQKGLLADISVLFTVVLSLKEVLDSVLKRQVEFGDFAMAEIWITSTDQRKIKLTSKFGKTAEALLFFEECADVKDFKPGEGLVGITWQTQAIEFWDDIAENTYFIRRGAAKKAGIRSAYGIPLFNSADVVGVLVLGLKSKKKSELLFNALLKSLSLNLGSAIRRKQLEDELHQVFNSAPDVICIAGTDGYFKKVNPALCDILGYTEQELLSKPLIAYIHPDDQEKTAVEFNSLSESKLTFNFETRSVTKSGKTKWMAWTSTPASEDGLLFCVARDITDKKELEELLLKTTNLARIGGWEIDLLKNTLYWSAITKEIHEVPPDYEPDVDTAINFYKEGSDRSKIIEKMQTIIETGTPTDEELRIITLTGKIKWVRVIAEADFVDHKCVRVYGSFQDIDVRKRAELVALNALEDKNTILESIGDAFFAVDKNWVVTYWNKMAEKLLGKPKDDVLQANLWEVFSDSVGSISYQMYHQAINTGQAVHFEDHYAPLKKWYEISAYPSTAGLSVYFVDITDRKALNILLSESEKRYSELFQLSPMPKWVYDVQTLRFLDVNVAAIQHYGYSLKEFLSMTIRDIRPVGDSTTLDKALAINEKSQQFTSKGIFTHQKKNGELMQVDIQSNAIQYKGKSAKVIIANDITERLNYIKAIEDQNKKFREVSWMQSHVIRAPLVRMMGLIDLIRSSTDDSSEKELMMEYLLSSANELDEVIRDITDISSTNTEDNP